MKRDYCKEIADMVMKITPHNPVRFFNATMWLFQHPEFLQALRGDIVNSKLLDELTDQEDQPEYLALLLFLQRQKGGPGAI